jgi:hypothetical protein
MPSAALLSVPMICLADVSQELPGGGDFDPPGVDSNTAILS